MKARTNFFGDRLHPSASYQADQWYWPTEDEFVLIEAVLHSEAYRARYRTKYGDRNASLLQEEFFRDHGEQYLWLAEHLPRPQAATPLTEAQVLASLDAFDTEWVEPWLAEFGEAVPQPLQA